jgi:hypothetical protein
VKERLDSFIKLPRCGSEEERRRRKKKSLLEEDSQEPTDWGWLEVSEMFICSKRSKGRRSIHEASIMNPEKVINNFTWIASVIAGNGNLQASWREVNTQYATDLNLSMEQKNITTRQRMDRLTSRHPQSSKYYRSSTFKLSFQTFRLLEHPSNVLHPILGNPFLSLSQAFEHMCWCMFFCAPDCCSRFRGSSRKYK